MLKAFAHQTKGMENGSMEFDQETLRPTYLFRSGVPGSSYALELAERIGLHKDMLTRARTFLGSDKWKLESLISQLERDIQQYQEQMAALASDRDRLGTLVAEYERRVADARTEVRELKKTATAEARELLSNAQASIERLVKDIRERSANKESIQGARKTLADLHSHVEDATPREQHPQDSPLEVGDSVRLTEGVETGEIVELRGSNAVVLWKSGRIRVDVSDLVKAGDATSDRESVSVAPMPPHTKNELDLRGLTGEEAIQEVEHFLDDALVSGLLRVDIIHGKGTGALRKRVTEFLKKYPHLKSYRLGEWNEGGSGVTVVEL
jgi:DNA mismatch repair protein MutS2